LKYGDLKLLPLAAGETAKVEITPARGVDVGAGPGKLLSREVRGGLVGLILDARGRPLKLPEEPAARRETAARWARALNLYPEMK
jgi:hypothetical protein